MCVPQASFRSNISFKDFHLTRGRRVARLSGGTVLRPQTRTFSWFQRQAGRFLPPARVLRRLGEWTLGHAFLLLRESASVPPSAANRPRRVGFVPVVTTRIVSTRTAQWPRPTLLRPSARARCSLIRVSKLGDNCIRFLHSFLVERRTDQDFFVADAYMLLNAPLRQKERQCHVCFDFLFEKL